MIDNCTTIYSYSILKNIQLVKGLKLKLPLPFLHLDFVSAHHRCSLSCVSSGTVDAENESTSSEPKAAKETIDFKELKRVDHILASLQRKVKQLLAV